VFLPFQLTIKGGEHWLLPKMQCDDLNIPQRNIQNESLKARREGDLAVSFSLFKMS
jgi:hypothetical protein